MNDSVGKLILRLVLGVAILLHGIAKLTGGIGGISGMVAGAGLPSFVAYGVYIGEVIGRSWCCSAGTRASAPHSLRSICCSPSASYTAPRCSR